MNLSIVLSEGSRLMHFLPCDPMGGALRRTAAEMVSPVPSAAGNKWWGPGVTTKGTTSGGL